MDQYKITICPEINPYGRKTYSYLTERLEDGIWEYFDNDTYYIKPSSAENEALTNLPDGDKSVIVYDNTED